MSYHSQGVLVQSKNQQGEADRLHPFSPIIAKSAEECFVKSDSVKTTDSLKEDETGSEMYGSDAMSKSRWSIIQTHDIIPAASEQARSRVHFILHSGINSDSILAQRDSVTKEQEGALAVPFIQTKQKSPLDQFLRLSLLDEPLFRLSKNSVWRYCSPRNSQVTKNIQIVKIRKQKSSHRRSLATNERPMNNFGGTLKKILLQKFKNCFGSRFKQIELLVKLESRWLGKQLLQELFNSSQLRPVIATMFATKHFHKAFRLSKVRSPECLAKFMRQIDAYQEAFQCGKIERVEMRE